jgi:nicotinamidase/pyrazinamidase
MQKLWPEHCVQGSAGAELARGFVVKPTDFVIEKGSATDVDSYSAL